MGFYEDMESKFYRDREKLKERLNELSPDKVIVFTNGCFDLLHVGHIALLCRARGLGDVLVVGVNSDESARRLGKGKNRPVNTVRDRCLVLAALSCVDFVTSFPEDTPVETLELLRPHIHTKGGDYRVEDMPEKAAVDSYGGKIVILPFISGYSTTGILEKGAGIFEKGSRYE